MRQLHTLIVLLLLVAVPMVSAQDNPIDYPAVQDGDTIEASFEDEITTHLYAFNASAGDRITVTMTQATDDLDPYLILFDNTGALLASDDDSGDVNFAAALTDIVLETDGIYFVMATSPLFADAFETETDDELAYVLTVSGQTTPESVDDAEIVSFDAPLLSIGESIEGESSEDAPFALFYLDGNSGDSMTVSLEDADFFTLLYVFAPDGSRLAADASFAEIDLDDDGVYMIVATEQFFREAMDDNSLFEGGNFVLVIE